MQHAYIIDNDNSNVREKIIRDPCSIGYYHHHLLQEMDEIQRMLPVDALPSYAQFEKNNWLKPMKRIEKAYVHASNNERIDVEEIAEDIEYLMESIREKKQEMSIK